MFPFPDFRNPIVMHDKSFYNIQISVVLLQWVPGESTIVITDATYSCDGQLVYASLDDGSVHILTAAKLQPKCLIKATAYLASLSRY